MYRLKNSSTDRKESCKLLQQGRMKPMGEAEHCCTSLP